MKFPTQNLSLLRGSRTTSALILAALALLLLAAGVSPVIFDDNEGLYAGAVREMSERGDWLVPTNNGFPRIQKPPLVYWCMLASTDSLGFNSFALRLPNGLATFGWIFATYLIARQLGGELLARASALTLASMLGVIIFTHLVQPEPFLACFTSLSLWSLIRLYRQPAPDSRAYLLFWVFLALGTLSKGLHGALWPLGAVAITYSLAPSSRSWLRPVCSWSGIALFGVLVLPWYLYMSARFPHFLYAHFINEQVGASLNCRYPPDAKTVPLIQFYLQHLLFWMPWPLFLPALVSHLPAVRRSIRPDLAPVITLLVTWTVLVLVSVAFSTRQDYYSLACWGEIAILFALLWMSDSSKSAITRTWLLIPSGMITAFAVVSIGFALVLPHYLSTASNTTAPISQRDTFADAIAGIAPDLWMKCLPLLWVFSIALLIGGAFATLAISRRRSYIGFCSIAGLALFPYILSTIAFGYLQSYFSLAEAAQLLNQKLDAQPAAIVACEAAPNQASSLFAYLHGPVHWVNAPFNNQYAQQFLDLGHNLYWDEPTLQATWDQPAPLYLIIEQDRLPYWIQHLNPAPTVLLLTGTRVVVTNGAK